MQVDSGLESKVCSVKSARYIDSVMRQCVGLWGDAAKVFGGR
jgi:hypothetical protein